MSRVLDHLGGSVYRTARYVATSVGLEESVWGRKVLARLNIIGEKVGRMLVLRGRPFKVDGHLMYLAGRSGPSVSFSTELLSERYEPETGKILKEILRPGMNVLDIAAVSLDDFLEQEGWPKIDFVKIDVEGAEPLVLKGMTRLLDRSSEITLIAEFAPACTRDGGCAPIGFLEALANCGFQIHILE